jgi:hypothetical protein
MYVTIAPPERIAGYWMRSRQFRRRELRCLALTYSSTEAMLFYPIAAGKCIEALGET